MRDYMRGFRRYEVSITAGLEHTATTFVDVFWARSARAALEAARKKWIGAAIAIPEV